MPTEVRKREVTNIGTLSGSTVYGHNHAALKLHGKYHGIFQNERWLHRRMAAQCNTYPESKRGGSLHELNFLVVIFPLLGVEVSPAEFSRLMQQYKVRVRTEVATKENGKLTFSTAGNMNCAGATSLVIVSRFISISCVHLLLPIFKMSNPIAAMIVDRSWN
jgi:hypothetical protein